MQMHFFTASEQSEREQLSIMTETVLAKLAPDMTGVAEFANFEKLFEFIGSKAKDKDERIVFLSLSTLIYPSSVRISTPCSKR